MPQKIRYAGLIHLIGIPSNPAEIEFDSALTNVESTGRIIARNAILYFNDTLYNQGEIALSFGTSDILGDITNTGAIMVKGNSNVTFWDDLVNDGSIQVSEGSTAVYFGAVSGSGNFNGVGTNFYEGLLSPGSSPGSMSFDGDVVLAESSTTQIELAGTAVSEYDRLLVAGVLDVAGELQIELLDDFLPADDARFQIFNAETLSGTFSSVLLPELSGNLSWDHSHLYTSGTLSVIPEPGTLTLLAAGTLLACGRRRVSFSGV